MSKSIVKSCTNKNITENRQQSLPSRIVEDFLLIWLDSSINDPNEDTRNSITQLQNIVHSVRVFIDSNTCIDFITDIENEKVFLIISAALAQQLLPLLGDITQVESIYIFCSDKAKHEQWTNKYRKVKDIFTCIHQLCEMLRENVRQSESDLTPISVVANTSLANMNELDQSFMYSQLLKEILLDLPHDEKDKKELVNYCRQHYSDNDRELRIIDEFEEKYDRPSPICWYTRECFTYSMLNKALRTQDIETIIKMDFFVRDLHRQIQQLQSQSKNNHQSFIVYRGQGMSNDEFEKMKKNKGCLLSFNNFLSTTMNKDTSMGFARRARNNPLLTAIFFHIEINPSISSTPFALLDKTSYYSNSEKEILFSMHTVFRVGDIKQIEDRLWQVNLKLTSDNDQQLTALTQQMRDEIGDDPGMHRMGRLMIAMGEWNKAEEIYTILLKRTAGDDRPELGYIHHHLGCINNEKGDLSNAISHYKQSLNVWLIYVSPDDPRLSASYSNIGAILKQQGDFDGALEHFKHALNIDLLAPQPNQLKIATRHNNIGLVLHAQEKYADALKCYDRALEIALEYLPSCHPLIAATYNNIGFVHSSMGDKATAISYYQKTLDIDEKSLPINHRSLSTTHFNIACILEGLHRYKEAFNHARRAVDIAKHTFSLNHPQMQILEQVLDRIKQKL